MEAFNKIDLRIGRILTALPFPRALRPAYKLTIDFGPALGTRQSSAQVTFGYPDPSMLPGRLVLAVVNFAPRNVAGFKSEVLVTGFYADEKRVFLTEPLVEESGKAELIGCRARLQGGAVSQYTDQITFDTFLQSKIILSNIHEVDGPLVCLEDEAGKLEPLVVDSASGSPVYLSTDPEVSIGSQLF